MKIKRVPNPYKLFKIIIILRALHKLYFLIPLITLMLIQELQFTYIYIMTSYLVLMMTITLPFTILNKARQTKRKLKQSSKAFEEAVELSIKIPENHELEDEVKAFKDEHSIAMNYNYHLLGWKSLLLIGAMLLNVIFFAAFYKTFNIAGISNFSDAIYFSIVTFTTLGYGDFTPDTFKITVALQAFSGLIMSAGLVGYFINLKD